MKYTDYLKAVDAGEELPIPEQTEYRVVLDTLTFEDNVALVTGKLYQGDELIATETYSTCQYKLEPGHIETARRGVVMELGRRV